jgi:COX assembly protein 2
VLKTNAYPTACAEVITALEECHARGFLYKSIGMCNTLKSNVNACLGEQRKLRAAANREVARARRDKLRKTEKDLGL